MSDNKHRFYKLQAYDRRNTGWLRTFIVVYINLYIVAKGYASISALMSQDMWEGIITFFSGNGITYAGVYTVVNILQIAAAVVCSATSPMLGKAGYWSIMAHSAATALGAPAICAVTLAALGSVPEGYTDVYRWLYPLALGFAGFNVWYFFKRRELFYKDTSELVTGVPEDIHKA